MGRDAETGGDLADPVGMAHPHHTFRRDPLHQLGLGHIQVEIDLSVLGGLRSDNRAAAHPGGELGTVADTQNGDPQFQHLGVIVGGGHIVDAVGAAGKDDAAVARRQDFLRGDAVIGFDLGVNVQVPHPPGDQLVVLSAKVQNKNFFQGRSHSFPEDQELVVYLFSRSFRSGKTLYCKSVWAAGSRVIPFSMFFTG